MKTALITGISRGIGLALAQEFLAEGYKVIGTTTTGKAGESSFPNEANLKITQLDLADSKSILNAAKEAVGEKIDILINNAGVMLDDEETEVKIDLLRETLDVNLIGTIDLTEKLIPALADDAHIVNISSMAGSLEDTNSGTTSHYPYHYPAYKISKCALNMYTRTLAMRLNNDGKKIIVSSIHPGWVKTAMGGDEAPTAPEEAAKDIYSFSISRPETGQFWFKDKKIPW